MSTPRLGVSKRRAAAGDVPPVVVFDTETTGLDSFARLVEIAAIRYHGGIEVDRFVTLVNPGIPIPYEATAVHGITDRMVRGSPKAADALRRFLEIIEDAVLVAHFAAFDLRIVSSELERARLPRLKNPHVCTRNLARAHLYLHSYRLEDVAHHLGVRKGPQQHRALGDALLAAAVYHKLQERTGNAAKPGVAIQERVGVRVAPARSKRSTRPVSATRRSARKRVA